MCAHRPQTGFLDTVGNSNMLYTILIKMVNIQLLIYAYKIPVCQPTYEYTIMHIKRCKFPLLDKSSFPFWIK